MKPPPACGHRRPFPRARADRGKFLPNPKLNVRKQLAEVCRFRHLSHRTENAYWHWMKGFILFHGKRHPREMGGRSPFDAV
ncbi:MAG: phage integrase N-terminal SAM-like domain-containing protein [Verrucomicrobia bacterium]|nr:phage integrase N-terminal SAM-like domain-containing protein [Verrucomicrobiota bacterium]